MVKVHFDEVRANKIKSWLLVFSFLVLIGILGAIVGILYDNIFVGVGLAVFGGIFYTLIVWYTGSSMILGMMGARPVTKKEFPHLFHTVEGLAVAAGIPTPKCYVIDDTALNAFATGTSPEKGIICVTTGLLAKLDRSELEGVIGHEMSHIKHLDIRVMMLAAVLVGVVTLLSDFLLRSFIFGGGRRDRDGGGGQLQIILIVVGLVLAILSPLIAQMIQLAISRKREYAADAGAVILTRHPSGLAGALRKIKGDPDPLVDKANRATAHLFISTPFKNKHSFFTGLFSTHPPLDERIRRVEEM